ncbi:Vps51/Vps67 [Ascosphaera apis ARSEF 7405]|uniref:Conserved oligomeric Golgi complex subunit 1 n=1 Tax=Ascosphaera apis ARSEF 7405 TaxID=392613 RepID=A0A167VG66_9EURO|nr:Vps51/Vps67 [Ascosphaera apis ARSEF 7405]
MAATNLPDISSLESWEDVFKYPIPTVRRVEHELRRDIASNRDKLRSLVGLRYRDLLDTAHTIVQMNDEIHQVEDKLSDIGLRCNPRAIEKKIREDSEAKRADSDKAYTERATAGQLAFLHQSVVTVTTTLRKRGSLLQCAKILSIARPLQKSLSQIPDPPPFLNTLSKQLVSLRRTVLKRADKRLAARKSDVDDLIEALGAYCLSTNSSSHDAVRHFHQVRSEAIVVIIRQDAPNERHRNLQRALQIYVKTLQLSSSLLSGRLTTAISRLTASPVLNDPDLLRVEGLNIDIFSRWLTDDIKNFTPWIKNDEFTKSEQDRLIKQWAKNALNTFITESEQSLCQCNDISLVLNIRKSLFEIWLPVQASTPTHSPMDVLDKLRETINKRLTELLREQATPLTTLGQNITSTIAQWPEAELARAVPALWRTDLAFKEYSDGAGDFKEALTNRVMGRTQKLLKTLAPYHAWLEGISKTAKLIDGTKSVRWENMIEEDEDPDTVSTIAGILGRDDYDLLIKEHEDTLKKAFNEVHDSLAGTIDTIKTSHSSAAKAAFILRSIREIRSTMPKLLFSPTELFADDIVPELYNILATHVTSLTTPSKLVRELRSKSKRCVGRSLWEGYPELPVQPSPSAFKVLKQLAGAMDKQGQDLWNPDTVAKVKAVFDAEVAAVVEKGIKEADEYWEELRKQGEETAAAEVEKPVESQEGDVGKEESTEKLENEAEEKQDTNDTVPADGQETDNQEEKEKPNTEEPQPPTETPSEEVKEPSSEPAQQPQPEPQPLNPGLLI